MQRIIIYFSKNGENIVNKEIKDLTIGNTKVVAKTIRQLVDSDILEIKLQEPYSHNYCACSKQASEDLRKKKDLQLVEVTKDLTKYDVVYLGYPNYCNGLPRPVTVFLKQTDLSNKIIKPFCTHEGDELGKSIQEIQKLCPNTKILSGLAIQGIEIYDIEVVKKKLNNWINKF